MSLAEGWAWSGWVVEALGVDDDDDGEGDGVVLPKTFGNIWYALPSSGRQMTLVKRSPETFPFRPRKKLAASASRAFWKLRSANFTCPAAHSLNQQPYTYQLFYSQVSLFLKESPDKHLILSTSCVLCIL